MSENIVSNIKKLMLDLSLYAGALILGPLIFFGGIGYLLDKYLNTQPIILIISVLVAFIFTNIFLYKKIKDLNQVIKKELKNNRKDTKDNEA
jgi:F0F1-type ATP synthase assembly protein I